MATEEQVYALIGRQVVAAMDRQDEIRALRDRTQQLEAKLAQAEACECPCKDEDPDA